MFGLLPQKMLADCSHVAINPYLWVPTFGLPDGLGWPILVSDENGQWSMTYEGRGRFKVVYSSGWWFMSVHHGSSTLINYHHGSSTHHHNPSPSSTFINLYGCSSTFDSSWVEVHIGVHIRLLKATVLTAGVPKSCAGVATVSMACPPLSQPKKQ